MCVKLKFVALVAWLMVIQTFAAVKANWTIGTGEAAHINVETTEAAELNATGTTEAKEIEETHVTLAEADGTSDTKPETDEYFETTTASVSPATLAEITMTAVYTSTPMITLDDSLHATDSEAGAFTDFASSKSWNILSALDESDVTFFRNDVTDMEDSMVKTSLAPKNDSREVSLDNFLQSEEDTSNPCRECKQDVALTGFHYSIVQHEVDLTWDSIDDEEGCEYKYTTEMNSRPFNFTRFYNHTGVKIPTRTLCGTQEVIISAENVCGTMVEKNLHIFIPVDPFDIAVVRVESREVWINITLPQQRDNCDLSQLIIQCSEQYKRVFTNFQDVNIVLEELRPFTKYSCMGEVLTEHESVQNISFRVETKEAAPGPVENLQVHNITESSLVVTWNIPESINGVLKTYEILLNGEPLYNAPPFCKNFTGNYKTARSITTNLWRQSQRVEIDDLPSNYAYRISVRAKTVEFGVGKITSASTNTPAPGEVENLDYNVDAKVENQPVAHLRWIYPCRTFASVNKVAFSIHLAEDARVTKQINRSINDVDFLQNLTIDLPLKPSTNYTIMIYTVNLETNVTSISANTLEFESPKGNTSEPLNLSINTNRPWMLDLDWVQPHVIFGNFLYYQLNITYLGALHKIHCKEEQIDNYSTNTKDSSMTVMNFVSPHRRYRIELATITSEGAGVCLQQEFQTKSLQSQPPRNVHCKLASPQQGAVVTVEYETPCDFNGVFHYYIITLIDQQGLQQYKAYEQGLSHIIGALKPETQYKASVVVVNDQDNSIESFCEFKTPAGIPDAPALNVLEVIAKVYDRQVEVLLRNDYFEDSHGEVRYFALLVGVAELWGDNLMEGNWNGSWPSREFWNERGVQYQATPENWEPLNGTFKNVTFKLGTDNCTGVVNTFCNGPLLPNTAYYLVIRGYTSHGYQSSNKLLFVTADDVAKSQNVVLIIGVLAGLVIILILAGIGCLYWKRRPLKPTSLEEANQIVHTAVQHDLLLPNPVKIEDFPAFYSERKTYLSDEYEALTKFGADLERNVGALQENRKKNRYINILPYDCSRVPLQGYKNDYINASYIKGYSEKVEYIATQGPLESTTADFWTMVMNENCRVVAMVAQFEEQKKTKCHRYFPECREQMELYLDDGGEMMVRCAYALNIDYYIERQIIVQAYGRQVAVTHLQFLNWPDFGCPDGTSNMLQFTKRLRRHVVQSGSKAVIHCSAGVGRTGTIIAVDILLQAIRDGREINIFSTVSALREQRTKMVQAESQYLYIYQCILDEILQPIELTEVKPINPIYENLEDLMEMKVLSKQNNNCDTQIEYLYEIKDESNEKEAQNDTSLNEEQNKINTMKNEETKV